MKHEDRDSCPPTDRELIHLGFEEWQIEMIRRLPPALQWDAYNEFIQRLMGDDDTEMLFF